MFRLKGRNLAPPYSSKFLAKCNFIVSIFNFRQFYFGKIPPKDQRNCSTDYDQFVKYHEKSMKSRWYCTAQFYLFFPEPSDAPHIVKHSQSLGNLIYLVFQGSASEEKLREGFSKELINLNCKSIIILKSINLLKKLHRLHRCHTPTRLPFAGTQ